MEKKRYLKVFKSQNDYDAVKKNLMGLPHVVYFEETEELLYVDEEQLNVVNYDDYIVILNTVDVIDGNLILNADNIVCEEKNNQFNLIIE
jgi:hypothetical protein